MVVSMTRGFMLSAFIRQREDFQKIIFCLKKAFICYIYMCVCVCVCVCVKVISLILTTIC